MSKRIGPVIDHEHAPVPDRTAVNDALVVPVKLVCALNVAVTLLFEFIVTVQLVAVLVQSPEKPANVDPVAGAAVSVTTVPGA
jgi:hypothetical protein